MSICSGIGNGIGGAIGKWGAGLGSALGLAAVVDTGTRLYTGYGLLETLSVPYIECPDGSFVSAMEWYGSGLKCPIKKPEPSQTMSTNSGLKAAQGYASEIEAIGGLVFPYVGSHRVAPAGVFPEKAQPGHYSPTPKKIDDSGNILNAGKIDESLGFGGFRGAGTEKGLDFYNYGFGGWGSSEYPNGLTFQAIRESPYLTEIFNTSLQSGKIIGLRVSLPSLPYAPPAGNLPPPKGFSPNPPQKREDCEETTMSCPCITPADIELAVKRALGLRPFAPEQLIRQMGAQMFAAPGPSVISVTPATLVDAIAAIAAANYMRAGYGRYPVIMPSSLINDDSAADAVPTQPLENFAEWFEWFLKQKDATDGEWPIDIAIVDGAKRQPLKFENLAEAIAELTGLLIQAATDADASVNAACTAAVAATKATNAAIVGQKNIECLIRFFGVRTGFKAVFVESPITPADPDDKNFNIRKFLTPSTQNLACLSDEDPFDFQALLDRMLRNTEITRASVARNVDKDGLPGDFARNQRQYDAAQSRQETEKELDKLEKGIQAKNPDFKVRIRVDTPANDIIAGNNFVIKRSPN